MSSWPSSASSITTWVTSNSAPTTLSQSPQAFFILLAAIVVCGWGVSASSRYPRWRRGSGIGWLVSYVTWARDFRYEPAMVVSTVAAARSAPGLMAMLVVSWCCASVGWCCASMASPAAGSITREPRLLSVAALRVIVAFAVCDYLLSSIRFSPVMSAGCSSPMMWRIEGATSARRPFLTVALLLSVT